MTVFKILVSMSRNQERYRWTPVEGAPETLGRCVIERTSWLVEQQNRGSAEQRPREGELLDHPRRAAVDPLVEDRLQHELLLQLANEASRPGSLEAANTGEEQKVVTTAEPQVERPIL